MTGWGRRSKKRPQRKNPSRGGSPIVDTTNAGNGPTLQSTTNTTTIPNSFILSSQADEDSQPNSDIRYRPRNIGTQNPESTNPASYALVSEQSRSQPERPRTLVNGVYYVHDPNSLPQPLGQGYIAWAMLEREAASQSSPRHPGESRWNNRTLRFWHLSTDFSRFRTTDDESNMSNMSKISGITRDEQRHNRHPSSTAASNKDLTLQRPYTAPPHQL